MTINEKYPWINYWSEEKTIGAIKNDTHALINSEIIPGHPLYERFVVFNKIISDPNVKSVFDIGCALGHTMAFLKGMGGNHDFYGGDISAELLKEGAKSFGDCHFIQCDGLNLGIKDDAFDLVISEDVQCIVLGYKEFLQELCRVTKRYLALSLRFRAKGRTVKNIDKSYQWSLDGKTKIPYITMNYREFINIIDEVAPHVKLFAATGKLLDLRDSIHIEGYGRKTMSAFMVLDFSGDKKSKNGFSEECNKLFDEWKANSEW